MAELIYAKTKCPEHQALTKVSEVIAALQNMQDAHGDLPIEICTHLNGVMYHQDIFYACNTYDDGTKNISIQSFPY
jgi:hypothetical protein